MAEPSIVQGLFGATPEAYQQQQQRQAMQDALAMAQLDPMQLARANIMAGANRAAGGIAGLMGVEDPQMRLISQRNALAKQIDMNDPESIMRGAQMAAQMGDTVSATALADYARKAASELALVQQRTAEKMTSEQRNALAFAASVGRPGSPEFNRAYQDKLTELTSKPEATSTEMRNAAAIAASEFPVGSPQYVERYREELKRLTAKPEKDLRFGVDREAYSEEKFSKPFAQLSSEEKAVVNRYIEDEKKNIADKSAVKVFPPGAPIPQKDWMEFRKFADSNPVMKKTTALISEAPNAIETISQVTSNDIAAKALPATLARLTGDTGVLSNADITRYARTGGLDDRLAQSAAQFFTGRGTTQQKDQAIRFVSAIYRGALIEQKQFIIDEAKQLGYTNTSNYDMMIKSIDDKLAKFKEVKPSTPQVTPQNQRQPTGNPLIDKYLVPANTPQ
jgi:molybdopterin converting factor small subunit